MSRPPRVLAAARKPHHPATREGGSCRSRLDPWLNNTKGQPGEGCSTSTPTARLRARGTAQRIRGVSENRRQILGSSRARLQGKARCRQRMLNRSAIGDREDDFSRTTLGPARTRVGWVACLSRASRRMYSHVCTLCRVSARVYYAPSTPSLRAQTGRTHLPRQGRAPSGAGKGGGAFTLRGTCVFTTRPYFALP